MTNTASGSRTNTASGSIRLNDNSQTQTLVKNGTAIG